MSTFRREDEELFLASRPTKNGLLQSELSVPGMKCAGCISKIESGLLKLPGVTRARVNLTTKRVTVSWKKSSATPPLLETLSALGFEGHLSTPLENNDDKELKKLIRALAVAGFGAGNIMMLSVGVWAGAEEDTRTLFHGLSALIAFPVLFYSGRIFFASAWTALKAGTTNMDVPISVGVLLTFLMSLYDTITHGPHAYFDAATSLLFFLLIGRTLDHMMRARARTAITGLQKLSPEGAEVLQPDGSTQYLAVEDLMPGMRLRIPAGARIPVNGTIAGGQSDIDVSIINGESTSHRVTIGDKVQAGALNLTGSVTIEATAAASNSFLADMIRLMETAETGRHRYRRIADRVSSLYSPVVHIGALAAFILWFALAGDVHHALTIAVSVLIITCPCALGLAVPMVQTVATKRLFQAGVVIKDGAALERLSEIDTIIFDKTGTLTTGKPNLVNQDQIKPEFIDLAAAMAAHSSHPLSKTLALYATANKYEETHISEFPGDGLEAEIGGVVYRLGRPGWAAKDDGDVANDGSSCVVLTSNDKRLATFYFTDQLRPSASNIIADLSRARFRIEILSGDRAIAVAKVANHLGISTFTSRQRPNDKVDHVERLSRQGRKVLMIGDGVNDAPALAAAHVSMAPASAADIGRNAADFVLLTDEIEAIPVTIGIARRSSNLMRQNILFAILYNMVAVPLAFFGYVTPLIAAIAMSTSSIIVVLNSLRLGGIRGQQSGQSMPRRISSISPPKFHEAVR